MEESIDWPSSVCRQCVESIESTRRFKESIITSHSTLFEMFSDRSSMKKEVAPEIVDEYDDLIEYSPSPADRLETPEEQIIESSTKNEALSGKKTSKDLVNILQSMGLLKCFDCHYNFSTFAACMRHMKEQHSVKVPSIKCCGELRFNRSGILDHLEFHVNPEKFACNVCDTRCDSSVNLTRHHKAKHSPGRYTCPQCDKVFKDSYKLRTHQNIHLPEEDRPYKCSYCPKAFAENHSVKRHIERVHEVKERYICEVCGKGFSSISTLWTHTDISHKKKQKRLALAKDENENKKARPAIEEITGSPLIRCRICGIDTTCIGSHMRLQHDQQFVPSPEEEELIPCKTCGEMVMKHRMYQHDMVKHKMKALVCSICNQQFKRYNSFHVHMDQHLDQDPVHQEP